MSDKKSINYTKKKSSIDKRLREDYIDNDIATIPCKVDSFNDVINRYSIKDYETLNPEFNDYINSIVDDIPKNYPIVINIISKNLTNEEKIIIEDTIVDELAYNLGEIENEIKQQRNNYIKLFIGTVVSGILLWILELFENFPFEIMVVVFWFFCETFISDIVIDGRELRKKHALAARLACLKVVFSSDYDDDDYSKDEKEQIYKEVINNINK